MMAFCKVNALVLMVSLCAILSASAEKMALSPSDIVASEDGKTLYMACATAGMIQVFDREREKPTSQYRVPEARELALSPDGSRIYAAAGEYNGKMVELDSATGEILRTFPAGHTPVSPIVSPDGRTLFYCNRFSRTEQNDVHAIDLSTGSIKASGKAIREPITMTLSGDGNHLWVVNHLPLMAANREHVFASLNIFKSDSLAAVARLDMPPGSFAIRDSAITHDGRYLFVSHTVGRFNVPTTHLDRGWINTSAVSIFDVVGQKYINTVLLDDPMQGAANPWGLAVTDDDAWLCVNASGTHEVLFIDLKTLFARLDARATPDDVVNDLAFLYGAKTRVKLVGEGARAIAVTGQLVYVPMYFSDHVNVIEMWDDGPGAPVVLPLRDAVEPPGPVRLGEMAFNDATLSYQNWLSCASCHPDARSDGVNWDLLNDGIGNPKNGRSLMFSHKTPPVMITGIRERADIAVRTGFRFIQFAQVPEETALTVDAYLSSLVPVCSPWLVNGELSPAAKRGKQVFTDASCIGCHNGEYYTDGRLYDVGVGPDELGIKTFVTPTLREVWRTAPYLFDGRAVTMKEVLTRFNQEDRHGRTSHLSEKELDDLIEYIHSL
jgi:DNA-binding beta-propeller fold protein YncE